jgi:hypothetical protein
MTRIIRKRDHGYSRRHKRHHRVYVSPEVDERLRAMDYMTDPVTHITLGDQDDAVFQTHDDTHNAWHRVLDAIGALLVYLHLARSHDNDAH